MGLLQAVPSTVLYMTFYERIKAHLNTFAVPGSPGIAGGLARCVAVSVISPLELVRTIQTGGSKESATSIMRKIFQSDGVLGLYRGWWSSIMRDAPFSAMYWYSFEFFKGTCLGVTSTGTSAHNNSHFVNFLSGSAAGIVAAVVTHPFDVIKTQQQLSVLRTAPAESAMIMAEIGSTTVPSSLSMSLTPNSVFLPAAPTRNLPRNNNTLVVPTTITKLYQIGGFGALYRGITMRLATVIPSSAIMVTVYEAVKNWEFES